MEKSILEQKLESTLQELEMPLGERISAEDLDFYAEVEDLTSEVRSSDCKTFQDYLEAFNSGVIFSREQKNRENQPEFRRSSEVYNGVGFELECYGNDYVLYVFYNQNMGRQLQLGIQNKRHKSILINRFYGDIGNSKLNFMVFNGEFFVIKPERREPTHLQMIPEQIKSLNGEPFTDQTADELMQYIRELVQAA